MIYTIIQVKELIEPIADKYGLSAVYLFGSYANGSATEDSDIDILIDKTGSSLVGMFAMGGLYNDLCKAVGKNISLVTTNALEQEIELERAPWLVENLYKEKVKIYG